MKLAKPRADRICRAEHNVNKRIPPRRDSGDYFTDFATVSPNYGAPFAQNTNVDVTDKTSRIK